MILPLPWNAAKGGDVRGRANIRLIRVAVVIALCSVTGYATAATNWMDDWWSSKTESSGGYLKGQQRGYASGGQMNVRWGSTTPTNLMSVQPPRFKAGCGGIDAYAGSISFLNPDMLVKKFQRILQNSAGVAFDMALQTLCPKCSEIMKSMEQLSNMLNGLALDDCKAANSLVNGLKSQAEKAFGTAKSDAGDVNNEKGWFDGAQSAFDDMVAKGNSVNRWLNDMGGKSSTTRNSVSECPADWNAIFPKDNSEYPRGLLTIAAEDSNVDAAYIPLLRGLVGDVVMTITAGDDFIAYAIGPCKENLNISYQDILSGAVYVNSGTNGNSNCTKLDSAQATKLKQWAKDNNDAIRSAMLGKSAIQPTQRDYINSMPMAVHYALRMAVASDQYDAVSDSLAEVGATQYMMRAINDLFKKVGRARDMVHEAQRVAGTKAGANCNASSMVGQLDNASQKFFDESAKSMQLLNNTAATAVQNFVTAMQQAQTMEASMKLVEASVSRTFGPSVSARLRAKMARGN